MEFSFPLGVSTRSFQWSRKVVFFWSRHVDAPDLSLFVALWSHVPSRSFDPTTCLRETEIGGVLDTSRLLVTSEQQLGLFSPTLTQLWISSYLSTTLVSLRIVGIPTLKQIVSGRDSFLSVRNLEISDLPELETLMIGQRCATISGCFAEKQDDGRFVLQNCGNLRKVELGNWVCGDYEVCELRQLPQLATISFGKECFLFAREMKLEGIFAK